MERIFKHATRMKKDNPSQVEVLRDHLLSGKPIDRVIAFNRYGIADLRSRLSNVKERYGIVPERWTKKGKRYLEYQLKPQSNGKK